MIEFNKILSDGRWGDIASFINSNFEKIRLELISLRHASILTFCKGYFSTELRLLNKYSSGKTGEYAFVGSPWPGTIYEWQDTAWIDTKVVPQIGEAVFIELLKRHIDNRTIYWDVINEVIKSHGGSGENPYEITVEINTSDIGKCDVLASGDHTGIVLSDDGSTYTITAIPGGTVTVSILNGNGYTVSQLNVDKVSQGVVSEYTFEDIDADHTMYIWMVEVESAAAIEDFLERSDLPGVTYSALGLALEAVRADYPDGLTQDVTISCIKRAVEIRGNKFNSGYGIWTSSIRDWNKDSLHTLTIDGNGLYTVNCKCLGGIQFINCDNIFFKNLSMENYSNYAIYTPEEVAGIMIRTENSTKTKNVVLYNCRFNGKYTDSSGKEHYARYGLRLKSCANFIMDSCIFTRGGAVVIYANGLDSCQITRNTIQGYHHTIEEDSGIAHPKILSIGGNQGSVKLEDNLLDCDSMREEAMAISGFSTVHIRRNTVCNTGGISFAIGSCNRMDVTSNVFYNNIINGLYSYSRRIFSCGSFKELYVLNNTVYLDSQWGNNHEFLSLGSADRLVNSNNIYVNKTKLAYTLYRIDTGVKEYISSNNVYSSPFKNDRPKDGFAWFFPLTFHTSNPEDGYIHMTQDDCRYLSRYQAMGYESGSVAVSPKDTAILEAEKGIDGYKLASPLADTYTADLANMAEFDRDYKIISGGRATVGAYNLFGAEWDETADTSTGYDGYNTNDRTSFDDSVVYKNPTDDTAVIRIRNKRRDALFRSILAGEYGTRFMRYGEFLTVALECRYNPDSGLWISDQNYDLTIKKTGYE